MIWVETTTILHEAGILTGEQPATWCPSSEETHQKEEHVPSMAEDLQGQVEDAPNVREEVKDTFNSAGFLGSHFAHGSGAIGYSTLIHGSTS